MREQQVGHSRVSIWATQRYRAEPLPDGQRDIAWLRPGQCLLDVFWGGERLTWIEASRYSSRRLIAHGVRLRLEVSEETPQRGQELGDGRIPQPLPNLARDRRCCRPTALTNTSLVSSNTAVRMASASSSVHWSGETTSACRLASHRPACRMYPP